MNSIGRVISVSYDRLIFEVSDFEKLIYNFDGDLYIARGVIDYVIIKNRFNKKFVYQVTRIEDKEIPLSKYDESSKFEYQGKFECVPIGTILNRKIEFNMKSYPFLQDRVYLASKDEMNIIFSSQKLNSSINLGCMHDIYPAYIDLTKLLSHHSTILGNTGSGKSTTIRQIISEINKKNTTNLHLHIFDIHDEYKNENNKTQIINVLKEYKIRISDLTLQDWLNLIKPSELVQLPIFQMALKIGNILHKKTIVDDALKCYLAHTLYYTVQNEAVAKRTKILGLLESLPQFSSILKNYTKFGNFTNDDEVKFTNELLKGMKNSINSGKTEQNQIKSLFESSLQYKIEKADYCVNSFENLLKGLEYAFLLEESKGNYQARSYCGTLETRIKNIEVRYSSILGDTAFDYEKNKSVFVYSISELEDDLLLFFTSYLLKREFSNNQAKELSKRSINIFILEEAHRYISREENNIFHESQIYKKIAREGRKFGCFLILSSQRPSELSPTVLSQCNNYIIHRIKNNIDLDYMLKTIPYIDKKQLSRLSYLPTGTAFVVGELFPIPVEINIIDYENQDISTTPKIKFK